MATSSRISHWAFPTCKGCNSVHSPVGLLEERHRFCGLAMVCVASRLVSRSSSARSFLGSGVQPIAPVGGLHVYCASMQWHLLGHFMCSVLLCLSGCSPVNVTSAIQRLEHVLSIYCVLGAEL